MPTNQNDPQPERTADEAEQQAENKLQLNRDTLRDLDPDDASVEQVKGGRKGMECTVTGPCSLQC